MICTWLSTHAGDRSNCPVKEGRAAAEFQKTGVADWDRLALWLELHGQDLVQLVLSRVRVQGYDVQGLYVYEANGWQRSHAEVARR